MNNRVIKFRVWDKQLSSFTVSNTLVLGLGDKPFLAYNTSSVLYLIPNTGQKDLGIDRFVLEQFTGLSDVNGKEIYEGDVVAWETNSWVVRHGEYNDGEGTSHLGYYLSPLGFDSGKGSLLEIDQVKILGNIHENPELLS